MLKNSKLFDFCHLKKMVRPETFGPYCVFFFFSCNVYADQIHRHPMVKVMALL